ncbi:MAG: transposase [Rhodobacteraceae bacterium]|nr:transposase [Paracoccaceae bacterium]
MSCYLRPRLPGASIFFTVVLAERGGDLLLREVARLRSAVAATRADRAFGIDAWVVLPDHLHCVWTLPEGDADYSVRRGAIKARFSMSLRRAGFTPPPRDPGLPRRREIGRHGGVNPALRVAKGEAGIWQRRFWEHHIGDDADFAAHVRYCWINPVKHGLVERPQDWPLSSVHRDIAAGRYDGA